MSWWSVSNQRTHKKYNLWRNDDMYVVSNTRNPMLNTANPRMKKGYENTLTALQSSGKPTTVKVTLKLNVYEFIFPEKVSAKIFCDVMRKRTLIVFLSDRAITSFCRNPLWKIGDIRCKWITTQEIKCCSNALHFCSSSLNYHFFFSKIIWHSSQDFKIVLTPPLFLHAAPSLLPLLVRNLWK